MHTVYVTNSTDHCINSLCSIVVTSLTAGDWLLLLSSPPPSPHAVILYLAPGTSEENVLDDLLPLFPYSPTTGTPRSSLWYPMITLSIPLGMVPMFTVILVSVLVVPVIETSGRIPNKGWIYNTFVLVHIQFDVWQFVGVQCQLLPHSVEIIESLFISNIPVQFATPQS